MQNDEKKGLIIKSPWIELILNGKKIWEIRGCNAKKRGKIYLIKSGSGKIYGEVELVDSILLNMKDFYKYYDKHCIPKDVKIHYRKIYAWVLKNPVIYDEPIPYKHNIGAVIWVNL